MPSTIYYVGQKFIQVCLYHFTNLNELFGQPNKCYVNSCLCVTKLNFAFWHFQEFFFLNIFNPRLVESASVEPVAVEG